MPADPGPLRLRVAIGAYEHTRALLDRTVATPGAELQFVAVDPMIAAYRRMVRELAYDVCELAPTTYLIAREAGVPLVALPVFLMRRFHHADILCRRGSGIDSPGDLEGRDVGVRAYSVTTGVWVRGLLAQEYGVDHRRIRWLVDDDEHVTSLRLPGNVERLAAGDSLAAAFSDGRIQAAFGGRAGIGRSGAPRAGWTAARPEVDHYPLFEDADAEDERSYRSTGVYPLHGLVCVRQELIERAPWLAQVLMAAFEESKRLALANLGEGGTLAHQRALLGSDPLPYGIAANRTTLEALVDFSLDQGLTTRRVALTDLFVPAD